MFIASRKGKIAYTAWENNIENNIFSENDTLPPSYRYQIAQPVEGDVFYDVINLSENDRWGTLCYVLPLFN